MPTSSYALIPEVAERLCHHQPKKILDVGIGLGMNGAVVRQWLDQGVAPWKRHLVGVEPWGSYRNPMWELYTEVVVDTVQNYLRNHPEEFDFVLMTDVLEQIKRPEVKIIFDQLKSIMAPQGVILVGTSTYHHEGAIYGNVYEEHRSVWNAADLAEVGFRIIRDDEPNQFGMRMLLGEWQND